jgi:hypothetical protein
MSVAERYPAIRGCNEAMSNWRNNRFEELLMSFSYFQFVKSSKIVVIISIYEKLVSNKFNYKPETYVYSLKHEIYYVILLV